MDFEQGDLAIIRDNQSETIYCLVFSSLENIPGKILVLYDGRCWAMSAAELKPTKKAGEFNNEPIWGADRLSVYYVLDSSDGLHTTVKGPASPTLPHVHSAPPPSPFSSQLVKREISTACAGCGKNFAVTDAPVWTARHDRNSFVVECWHLQCLE